MFDFIRSHQRLMQLILLALIVPSFIFFGVPGLDRAINGNPGVAKVGGQSITQAELDNAQREQVARMRQTYGAAIDAAMFDTPEARAQTLDGLIGQRVLTQQARKQSLGTSDRQLQETIMAIPSLQDNGRFSLDRYKSLLAQQGMSETAFEQRLREDLSLQQLNAAIENSVIVPQKVVDRFSSIVGQRREVRPLLLKVADYASQVKLAPDAVQKAYDAKPGDYMKPESAKVEYVVLSAEALARQVKVPDADARVFYEQNRKRYEMPESRRASHILVAVAKDAGEADKAKARAKAEDLLRKIRAASQSTVAAEFAKLAKQSSDDPGSVVNGGDLDYLGKGATVPPFEAALFALKENEISDVVQSDFGFHIIELTGVKPAQVKPFDGVKAEIDAELGKQLAQKKYADAAEAFANGVYEQGDSLAPTAQKFGLTVSTADQVTRQPGTAADATSPLSSTKLLNAIFSPDSIKSRRNTEAVETSPGTLVAARLLDHQPATRRPLAEVAETIKAQLVDAEARRLAGEAGKAMLAQLRSDDPKGATFGAPTTVSRVENGTVPREAVTEILRTDATKLPAYAGVALPTGDYTIYQITGLSNAPALDGARRVQLTQSIAKQLGAIEFGAYMADLRRRSKVQVSAPYAELIEKKDTVVAKTAS